MLMSQNLHMMNSKVIGVANVLDHLREKDKTNKMNQRVDVRYVLDQYSENEEYRNRANNYTKEFLKQFYDDEKEKDSWFK